MSKKNYLSEPTLNSELLLVNNSKKLKEDETLFNDTNLQEILELRSQYEELDLDESPGLQRTKRDIRNRIRDLSSETYVYRDENIFGAMALQVIDNIIRRPNFSGYSYKDEMKSLAIEHILKYTYKFDTYKQSKLSGQFVSAFTYISTIIFNAFVATINKQNDEHAKAKQEFLETQKLLHRDHNESTFGDEVSTIDKRVKIFNIENTLFEEIKKIIIDCEDILVEYPDFYKISLDEYDKIIKWANIKKINLSVIKYNIESDV